MPFLWCNSSVKSIGENISFILALFCASSGPIRAEIVVQGPVERTSSNHYHRRKKECVLSAKVTKRVTIYTSWLWFCSLKPMHEHLRIKSIEAARAVVLSAAPYL